MAKRENFTAERIAKLQCAEGKKQSIYWDGKVPTLGIRVTEAGSKSFIFETWMSGKTIRITIGSVNDWPIDGPAGVTKTARYEARRLKNLTDQGIDPRKLAADQAAKHEEEKAELLRQDVTLRDAWATYIEERKPKWSARHLDDHQTSAAPGGQEKKRGKGLTKPGALAPLMSLKLSQIDAAKVKGWLKKEAADRPTRARLAFNLFRIFVTWCESEAAYRGLVPQDAIDQRIARDALPKNSTKEDCLQKEQLKPWFSAVCGMANPVVSTYLQILLLTGARRESLAALKWEDVDFKWKTLNIRDKESSKGGENGMRTIPLTPYVASILTALKLRNDTPPPRYRILHGKKIENDLENWQPSPWVFSSKTSASGRLADPTQHHYKACAIAEIDHLTLHGLRRSFATLTEWVEAPVGVVAQIMGHRPSATAERHYKRRPIDLLRMWRTKIEDWILDQAGITFDADKDNGGNTLRAVQS